ncbi:MAG: hypothetical protein QG608_1917 [Actinomycetota bacterium]|nr:hypothetical protein [Actinomycetota bacterium]
MNDNCSGPRGAARGARVPSGRARTCERLTAVALVCAGLLAAVWGAGAAAPLLVTGQRLAAVPRTPAIDDPNRSVPPGRSSTRSWPPSLLVLGDPPGAGAGTDAGTGDANTAVPQAREGQEASGHVVPFRPENLVLPDGTRAPVHAVGVRASDASLEIPEDPRQVGWWRGGALAGESTGSLVLAGHVDSRRYGLGALSELGSLRPGQVITVGGGGQELGYQVVSTRLVRQSELLGQPDVLGQAGPHRLVLLTCGGPFDRSQHRYRDNLVVQARPVTRVP